MGIENPTQLSPKFAPHPTGTPAELLAMGESLRDVWSCAIPEVDANKVTITRGCPRAGTCQKFFKNPKIGDFAPRDTRPGSAGTGPENVPFSIETAEGGYLESFMPCHVFLGGPYGRMMASRNPETNLGEKISILGVAGEAQIMISTTLPRTPGGGPKGTDMTLITTTEVIVVPKHKRPQELDSRWAMRRARAVAEAEEIIDEVVGVSSAEGLPVGAVSTTTAVESLPLRRKGA